MQAESTQPSSAVRDRFLADHRRLENLLERLLSALDADEREKLQALWTEFEESLRSHLELEEQLLLPNLPRTREREARSILAEHRYIRARLTELGAGIDLRILRLDCVRAFIDELRAHAQHEDKFLYSCGDMHLDASEPASLLNRIAQGMCDTLHQKTA